MMWVPIGVQLRLDVKKFMQPVEWAVAGCFGSLMAVALVVLRIYLGWSYVGGRLLSAAVAYEESGW